MKVLIFGATGVVGQGVPRVSARRGRVVSMVQTAGRTPTGVTHPRLREVVHADLLDYSST